jgi:glycosyltransferase involved in cell wall biosynthesis
MAAPRTSMFNNESQLGQAEQSVGAPAPLQALSEEEHVRRWGGVTDPLVSIVCATYNHAPFIREALDGFLGQQTDFPFEIVVRDDASTDGTTQIIREYAARYPRIIRPIIEEQNTFSRGVSPIAAIGRAARGTYIANCEGDDYWIAADKLARQVDALRARPDATLCFHDVAAIRDGQVVQESWFPAGMPSVIPRSEAYLPLDGFPMPVSWVYRRDACDFCAEEFDRILNQDNFVLSQLGRSGCLVQISGRLSVYRLHATSSYSSKSERFQVLNRLNSFLWISRYHFRTGSGRVGRQFALVAMYHASAELWRYGPSVSFWVPMMFLRAALLKFVDPKRWIRKRLRMR